MLKKELMLLIALLSAGMMAAPADLIWQLGKTDRSCKDFGIDYYAWEYGNAPWIQQSKEMDHETYTFNYTINENKLIPNPMIVNGLYPEWERRFIHKDEMVCNLAIKWNEEEDGRRLLTVRAATTINQHGGVNGIEIIAQDGRKKIYSLPDGYIAEESPDQFKMEFVFDAKKGENKIVIANVSMAKHYTIKFDSISLEKTDRNTDFRPIFAPSMNAFSAIYHPGEKILLNLKAFNVDIGEVTYTVRDYNGKTVANGNAGLKDGIAQVSLPSNVKGYFTVECGMGKDISHLSYVVIEPVKAEYIPESRFGCHALFGDSYRPRYWEALHQTNIKRAFLGGAKWARLHSVHWALREPEKGKYDWSFLDTQLALAEKYKIMPLVAVGTTPEWSSTSSDKALNCCGNYNYLYYPPKDLKDWGDFMTVFMNRYGNRLQHIEIGNEPGYTSAFWTCGSAPDFGKYLKTAYDAIHKVSPETVVYPGAPIQVDFLEEATAAAGGKPAFDVLSVHYLGNYQRSSTKTNEWKDMLVKMGKTPEFINSEDMGWNNESADPKRLAAAMVQSHVRDAARGVFRTFAFMIFESCAKTGLFDLNDYPQPGYAVYRTMTHQLEYSKYTGDLSGAEFEAYLFDRKGTPVIVYWKDVPGRIRLPLGAKQVKVVNCLDQEKVLRSADGNFELDAEYMPKYVIGGNINLLKQLAEAAKIMPKEIMLKPGKDFSTIIRLPKGIACSGPVLPDGWKGSFANSTLKVTPKPGTVPGMYDCSFRMSIGNTQVLLPVLLEVSSGNAGNQVVNGDFEKGGACWFYPNDKKVWDVLPNAGMDGSCGVCSKGMTHFGMAGAVKVRAGERYLVAYDIRGEGTAGLCAEIKNAQGKTLWPKQPGMNMLYVQANPEWKRVSEEIKITDPESATFKISVLANYGDKTGKVVYLDNFVIARLTDIITPTKVLNHGFFKKAPDRITIDGNPAEWADVPGIVMNTSTKVTQETDNIKWQGSADLSVTARVMMNQKNFYLFFEVKDDKDVFANGILKESWQFDSIQFALDPKNDNKGYSELLFGKQADGKMFVYKLTNYWTPELPENITRSGVLKDAEIAVKQVPGGVNYEVRIPINELYPLKGTEDEIGFNFLVNDNDGHGRKYMEWSAGIGSGKDPSRYGVLRLKK